MTRILKHIVFVAVIAVALLFSAGASPTVMAAAMAAVAAAAAIGIAAVRHERQKYATLLEAIRNNDFTMRFQKGDKEINALLDSLTEIIKQSKSGTELRERYYKAIIDRVNAGIIAIDSNGNVRICNDNALKMLGMKYAANTAAINRSAWFRQYNSRLYCRGNYNRRLWQRQELVGKRVGIRSRRQHDDGVRADRHPQCAEPQGG